MKIGDRVAYSEVHLRSIGGHEVGHMRGIISALSEMIPASKEYQIADINWSDGTQGRVLTSNLQPMKRSK
jgi:hypothetical protein